VPDLQWDREGLVDWQTKATVGSFVVSILAFAFSGLSWNHNRKTDRRQQGEAQLLLKRQLFLQLWPYISTLAIVNPDPAKVVEVDVLKAVNALELVAVCWEAEAVDRDLIRRSFGDTFIEFYEAIQKCTRLPSRGSGESLLAQAPAIRHVYTTLLDERKERDKKASIPSLSRA
jgi:hypothetical protein